MILGVAAAVDVVVAVSGAVASDSVAVAAAVAFVGRAMSVVFAGLVPAAAAFVDLVDLVASATLFTCVCFTSPGRLRMVSMEAYGLRHDRTAVWVQVVAGRLPAFRLLFLLVRACYRAMLQGMPSVRPVARSTPVARP